MKTLYTFLLSVLFFLILYAFLPTTIYAVACTLTFPPPSPGPIATVNSTYTISGQNCTLPGGNNLQLVITQAGQEVFRQLILATNPQTGSFTYTFSNFISAVDAQRFGMPNDFVFVVEERNILGVWLNEENLGSLRIEPSQTSVNCGDLVSSANRNLCPAECPAVAQIAPNYGMFLCTLPTPTQTPDSCSISNETAIPASNGQWYLSAIVDGRNLRTDSQYTPVAIRTNRPANPGRDYYFPSTFTGGNVNSQLGMNNGEWVAGDTIVIAVLTASCSTPSICRQICRSQDIFLQSIIPTVPPNVTPIPTGYPTAIQGIENRPVNSPGGNPYELATCAGSGGSVGIRTAVGCIPTSAGALFSTLFRIGMGIAGGIAFLLILLGGMKLVTSTGNPERINEGREIMTAAITGLLLIIFSIFILRVVGVDILGIPGFEKPSGGVTGPIQPTQN